MAAKSEKPAKKPLHEYPERVVGTSLYTQVGIDSSRRNGFHALEDNIMLTAAGNTALFVNIATGLVTCITGPDEGGIGAVCVHPSRRFFVLCEKRPSKPLIRVMSYPEKTAYKTLEGGAVLGFSACCFNKEGDLLATVAIEPDYVLTVWNWKEQRTVLRNKAFSSDVYAVAFNPFNDGLVVTAGMGHIKFWSMAQTFTGLKLQGTVGKFGRVEISDICAFCQLPDGKVVSGSESGALLLWEGNLVKCELYRVNTAATTPSSGTAGGSADTSANSANSGGELVKCHDGPIEVMQLIEDGRIVLSAGHDGYLRYWSLEEIDAAENSGTDKPTALKCLREFFVGEGVKAKAITQSPDGNHWILLDGQGTIRRVPYWGYDAITTQVALSTANVDRQPLVKFNAGGLTALAASPVDHTCVTGGEDGTVRCLNYILKSEHYKVSFPGPVFSIQFLAASGDAKLKGRNLLVTFLDGSIRILQRQRNTFTILSEFRAHTGHLVAVALDETEQHLYTFAADKTAFYTKINADGSTLTPVGFRELPLVPTAADWLPAASGELRCAIGFATGEIITIDVPAEGSIDHAVGFRFEGTHDGVGYRQKMKPPEKPKKQHIEGMDDLQEEESSSSDDEEDEEVGPWGVNFIRRGPNGRMLVGMNYPELVYEYALSKRYPNAMGPPPYPAGPEPIGRVEEPGRNLAFRSTVVKSSFVSNSKDTLIFGLDQGRLMLRSVNDLNSVAHAKQLHDGLHGVITGACLSFDGSLLITTATDGMMFSHAINKKDSPTNVDAATLEDLPVAAPPAPKAIAHSIQTQKELDDAQKVHEAAESKKQGLLHRVQYLHSKYEEILKANDAAEFGKRCSDAELVLDDELMAQLADQKQRAIESAAQDFVWNSAKKKVLADRLKGLFVDTFETDAFEVRSFQGPVVTSFRAPKFSERHLQNMALIKDLLERPGCESPASPASPTQQSSPKGNRSQSPVRFGGRGGPGSPGDGTLTVPSAAVTEGATQGSTSERQLDDDDDAPRNVDPEADDMRRKVNESSKSVLGGVKSQLEKAEERRRERLELGRKYKSFLATNPRHVPPDAAQLADIAREQKHMGDYVLKSNPDYVIPDHLRPTAERKTRQLILLEHSIHELRCDFNKRLLAMRDVKGKLIESLNEDVLRIRDICQQLKTECVWSLFNLADVEQPEKRFDVTKPQLEAFEVQRAKMLKRQEALERAKRGFGDLAQADEEEEAPAAKPAAVGRRRSFTGAPGGAAAPTQSTALNPREKFEVALKERRDMLRPSDLEEEERTLQREQLSHEKALLEKRISKTCKAFDETLNDLLREKLKVEADLIMADMRVLLLYREFLLLQEFRKKDNELAKLKADRQSQQDDIITRTRACADRVASKVDELAVIQRALEGVKVRAQALIDTAPEQFQKPLQRVFLKKIKRLRKGDDEDDDDDVTSSDEDDEGEDEFADDGDTETCPAGCDESLFQQVLAFRELRLDEEDRAAEVKKAHDVFKKEEKQLNDQAANIDKLLREVEKETNQFQNEKQQKLNLLETIVVLKLSQIKCLTPEQKLPYKLDADNIIVFTSQGFTKLKHRIRDLGQEKIGLRQSLESLLQERHRLSKKKSRRTAELAEWEGKVNEVQLLKFGQKVDLELLETISVDRESEELKLRLKEEELHWEREFAKQNDRLSNVRMEQQQKIAENTALLKDLGSQRAEQHTLEDALKSSTAKIVAKMSGGSKIATAADRAHLKDLIVAQQQEIDALKNEIALLRRKGGHVYSPVMSKVPPQSA